MDLPLTESISLFGTAETIIRGDSHTFDAQVGMARHHMPIYKWHGNHFTCR